MIAAVAGGGVLALTLLIVAVLVALPGPTPREMADQAGRNLAAAAGTTYTGRYASGPARLNVTRAGSGNGFFSAGGTRVGEVELGAVTYLKAGADFWRSDLVTAKLAGRLDGRWAKPPSWFDAPYLPPLSPQKVGQGLRQAVRDSTGTTAVTATLHGAEVTRLTAGGMTYYISRRRPYTVLRIAGTADGKTFAFDVTSRTASTMGPVFTSLRDDVSHLANALAPSVTVQPINGGLRVGRCDASGCQVRTDVLATPSDNSIGSIRVTMTVVFRKAGHHPPFTCSHSDAAAVRRNTTLYCRTGGSAWSSWYGSRSRRPRLHPAMRLDATLNSAGDVTALLGELAREQHGG